MADRMVKELQRIVNFKIKNAQYKADPHHAGVWLVFMDTEHGKMAGVYYDPTSDVGKELSRESNGISSEDIEFVDYEEAIERYGSGVTI